MYSEKSKYTLCIVAGGNVYFCDSNEFNRAVSDSKGKFNLAQLPDGSDMGEFKKALEI